MVGVGSWERDDLLSPHPNFFSGKGNSLLRAKR